MICRKLWKGNQPWQRRSQMMSRVLQRKFWFFYAKIHLNQTVCLYLCLIVMFQCWYFFEVLQRRSLFFFLSFLVWFNKIINMFVYALKVDFCFVNSLNLKSLTYLASISLFYIFVYFSLFFFSCFVVCPLC